ncbi:hypothetical protein MML48_2g00015549 [Holotrichia oblita]|uniref:Uncharacterized protein n=1 Tax=Holotrichia oblita TaxID=644536 RepID=A0ACB9TKL4_HOLOL|nr:hypothetical protein MML48_2g00015549 [Holotrichia oblita]
MWLELTDILNSIPTGPAKSAEKWRKTWNDLKKNTKKKVSAMNAYRVITGGGPPLEGHLNDEEEQILTIVKPTQILGDPEVVESQVIFEWNVKNVENTTNETVTNRDTALTENNIVEDKGNILEAISPQINYDEHDYCPLQNNIDENIAEKCQKKKKIQGRLDESISNSSKLLN